MQLGHGNFRLGARRAAVLEIVQIVEKLACVRVALLLVLSQCAQQQKVVPLAKFRANLAGRRRILVCNLEHHRRRVAAERFFAGQHQVEQNAQRKDVARSVQFAAHHLLGRHV